MKEMHMGKLIGNKVYIRLKKESSDFFGEWFGKKSSTIGFVVTGIDKVLGLWVEGDDIDVEFVGNPKKVKKAKTDIFIPWHYIDGILYIRDKRAKLIKDDDIKGFKKSG